MLSLTSAAMGQHALSLFALGQHAGKQTKEFHLPFVTEECTVAGGCASKPGLIVLDSNWRWTHNVGGYYNCFTGNAWNATYCPDVATCTKNCAIDVSDFLPFG